jgi:phenylpyruvate tautomerase PptA (4-oxalocrotonate tautomerase family)
MPYIKLIHSGSSTKTVELAASISKAASAALGKPEMYVCCDCQHNPNLLFGGSNDPSAMIQVQSIGGSCSKVCETLTSTTASILGIDSSRIFVNFQSFQGADWAMSGSTFG